MKLNFSLVNQELTGQLAHWLVKVPIWSQRSTSEIQRADAAYRQVFDKVTNLSVLTTASVGKDHRPVTSHQLDILLARSLSQYHARIDIDKSVCNPAATKLGFELDALGVAYRTMEAWGDPDRLAKIGVSKLNSDPIINESLLYHRHVRAAVREQDGSLAWKVIDPTVGQFFEGKNGAPRPAGNFFGPEKGMGVYSYPELQNAFFNNRQKFRGMASRLNDALKERYPRLTDQQRTDLIVNILYGNETDVGVPPKPWQPDPASVAPIEVQRRLVNDARKAMRALQRRP
jgi:hypothetical protein